MIEDSFVWDAVIHGDGIRYRYRVWQKSESNACLLWFMLWHVLMRFYDCVVEALLGWLVTGTRLVASRCCLFAIQLFEAACELIVQLR